MAEQYGYELNKIQIMERKKIVVVGSSNIDMVARVHHLPRPGETVGDARFMQVFGGKGANQAVAAARLGGDVDFVTSLGNDMFAEVLTEHFKQNGIAAEHIRYSEKSPTGTALIYVSDNAENCIAVAPGSNGELTPDCLESFKEVFDQASVVVMQAEIPYETIVCVARYAHSKGVKVLFNPAPACRIDAELFSIIDILVVNETEAEYISGQSMNECDIPAMAQTLRDKGAKSAVITLGARGAYMASAEFCGQVPSYKVEAVDTTGAGDTFCGALAVACANEALSRDHLSFACAAAALSATREGAQPSIPTRDEVLKFIETH